MSEEINYQNAEITYPDAFQLVIKKKKRCAYIVDGEFHLRLGASDDEETRDGATLRNLRIRVRYFDAGTETIQLGWSINGTSETNTATIVTKTNTNKWKTAKYKFAAVLGGEQYPEQEYGDVRIVSTGELYVEYVITKDLDDGSEFLWSAATNATALATEDSESDDYEAGVAGWFVDRDTGKAQFTDLLITGEIHASVFVKDVVNVQAGTIVVAKSAGALAAKMNVPNVGTWTAKFNDPPGGGFLFANNDICYIKGKLVGGGIGETYFTVSARVSNGDGTQSYMCTWNNGTKNVTYRSGQGVTDLGISGNGYLVLTADAATGAPSYSVYTHSGSPWTDAVLRGRFGNLNGIVDGTLNPSGYGIYTSNGFFSGTLVATLGSIGGFTIGTTTLTATNFILDSANQELRLGSGNNIIVLDAADATYRLWVGNGTPASANFSVTQTGSMAAKAGTIGGWTIGSSTLSSGSITLNSATPKITLGSITDYLNNTGIFMGLSGGAYKFSVGTTTKYFAFDGTNPVASGNWIDSDGVETSLQTWKTNIVFSSASATQVNWTSGTIQLNDGRTFSIVSGNTGAMAALNYIYLDTAVSSTVLQKTTTYSTAVGPGKVLIAAAQNNATGASVIPFSGQQPIIDGGAQIVALSITSGSIAAGAITAAKISVSQLSAISADMGSITAGTITGGTIRTASSGARTEMHATNLFGLGFGGIGGTDGTIAQWYAKASDGKFYAAGGKLIIDANNLTISGDAGSGVVNWKTSGTIRGQILHNTDTFTFATFSSDSLGQLFISGVTSSTQSYGMIHGSQGVGHTFLGLVIGSGSPTAPAKTLDVRGSGRFNGHLDWGTDATYDFGASGGNRVRDSYITGTYSFLSERAVAHGVYDRANSDTTVSNTAAETTLYSKSITANDLGSTGGVRVTVRGSWLNNTGANRTMTVRFKLGATTIHAINHTLTTGAATGAFEFDWVLFNTATNAQRTAVHTEFFRSGAAVDASRNGAGTASEDTTSAKTLAITVQWDAANANATLSKKIAFTELMPA